MDHHEINEKQVLERYLQGRLDDDETSRFEAHLLECSECFEQVRWGDDLGHGLRVAAAEDVTRATVETGILAWLARAGLTRAGRGRAAAWLLGLAVLAVPSVLYFREHVRLRALVEPQINTPVFALGATRDGAPSRVSLGDSPEWIVLTASASTLSSNTPQTCRATLLDATGETVWQGDGLAPDAGDRLVISFYSTLLRPGIYELRISSSQPDAANVEETFSFEVVR